jgi:carboxyl-terminal processing protease
MKRIVAAVIIFFLFADPDLRAQLSAVQQKAIVVKRMAELKHYSPRPVDDSFSVSVFKTVLNAADSRRLLFTAAEYQQLLVLNNSLDDELQGKGWMFLDKFTALYKMVLTRADSIVSKLLQKPFDFSADEKIMSSKKGEGFNFSTDVAALTARWSRYLKYIILNQVYDAVTPALQQTQSSAADSSKKMTFKAGLSSLEPAIREKVKKAELKALKKILDHPAGYSAFVTELYLNAIASCFDPHTNYFSPQGKEEFQSHLSTEAYFFGIALDENEKGQIIIDQLTPGGPAWRSGELNKGDELLSLQWEGKELKDMTGTTVEEVYDILDELTHERLAFKFRKADGTVKTVSLRKEKSDNEENIVKGFVLKGEKKIGYILLPGFYTEWENESGSSCANDVAKEIVKLKKENIDGLILDVRFNGGGSVGEALDMIGIFIDEGPLAAVKTKDGKQSTLKDPNRGTIYDGPMTLMVNGQSASASELLAASLQDYKRAVIVGSNTYGKATMQQMFPLDTITGRLSSGSRRNDMIKITSAKIYRLNGRSAQLNGVAPDIALPDAFDGLEFREKFTKYALASDTAKANTYYKPLLPLPVAELAKRSAERTMANSDFRDIKKIIEAQQKAASATTQIIPLKWDSFEKWIQEHELQMQVMKGEGNSGGGFKAENHEQDKQLLRNNQYAREINEVWLNNLAGDIYIQETFLILTDLINLQKPATKN